MNKVIIAAAGSGKTTHIVNEAIRNNNQRILITTYTDANTTEIKSRFYTEFGAIPKNITVLPWYTFLLKHGVRPFQGIIYKKRIPNIHLISGISAKGISKDDVAKYYFDPKGLIYSDKISAFAYACNEKYNGAVISRISQIFDAIYIDELQDLAGWDLEFLELLMQSNITLLLVGDPRQATLATNHSNKNRNKSQTNLLHYLKSIKDKYSIDIDETSLDTNHRCHKDICSFSNELYRPEEFPPAKSDFDTGTEKHVGVFLVREEDVDSYMVEYTPIQLRYSVKTEIRESYKYQNFRKSKGLTYNRTLIYPTSPILDWIFSKKELAPISKCGFYVALTRARYSVGIIVSPKYYNKKCNLVFWRKAPQNEFTILPNRDLLTLE